MVWRRNKKSLESPTRIEWFIGRICCVGCCRVLPFAIGTETLGAIVSPSTRCGDTGLRPTFGSVSRSGAMVLCWSLDKIGPICRSAEDAAIVFSFINGTDNKDPGSVAHAFNYTSKVKDWKKLRIAYAE